MVNGRMFLNNVSLGIYGVAVRSPAYRDAKVRMLLENAAEVMRPGADELAPEVVDDLGHEHPHPTVVLVSNNPYALDHPLARGTRLALDSGQLGLIVLDAPGDSPRVLGRAWSAPQLEINAPSTVHAGVDGEAVALEPPPPVHYPVGGSLLTFPGLGEQRSQPRKTASCAGRAIPARAAVLSSSADVQRRDELCSRPGVPTAAAGPFTSERRVLPVRRSSMPCTSIDAP